MTTAGDEGTWAATIEAIAVVAATGLAWVSLRKQARDEGARRKALDGRISAQAYAARRTIRSWLDDPTRPRIQVGPEEVAFVVEISRHFPAVEERFERLTADAPDATPEISRAVHDAFVLFNQATARVYREARRAEKLGERDDWEFNEALRELTSCIEPLTRVIDPALRDR